MEKLDDTTPMPPRLFPSFAALLKAQDTLTAVVGFTQAAQGADSPATPLLHGLTKARQTLRFYLFMLREQPTRNTLRPATVQAAFDALPALWQQMPPELQAQLAQLYPITSYPLSLAALMATPDALLAAKRDLPIRAAEFLDEAVL